MSEATRVERARAAAERLELFHPSDDGYDLGEPMDDQDVAVLLVVALDALALDRDALRTAAAMIRLRGRMVRSFSAAECDRTAHELERIAVSVPIVASTLEQGSDMIRRRGRMVRRYSAAVCDRTADRLDALAC